MSGNRRDPGDFIGEIIVGAIVAYLVGLFLGKKAAQLRDRKITFSDTLEVDPDKTYTSPHTKAAREKGVSKFGYAYFIVLLGLLTIYLFSQSIRFWFDGDPNTPRSSALLIMLLALGAGAFTGWNWKKFRQHPDGIGSVIGTFYVPEPLNVSGIRIYTITLPKSTEWQAQAAGGFMAQVLQRMGGRLTFQIIGEEGRIVWRMVDLRRAADPAVITQTVHAFYPAAEVSVQGYTEPEFGEPFYRYVMSFEQATNFLAPIREVHDLAHFDPLTHLVQEMSVLLPGERITYTLLVADVATFVYDQVDDLLSFNWNKENPLRLLTFQGWLEMGAEVFGGETREARFEAKQQKIAEAKLRSGVHQCLLLIQVDAPTRERLEVLARFDSHLRQFEHPEQNLLVWYDDGWPKSIRRIDDPLQAQATDTLGLLDSWLTNGSTRWRQFRLLLGTQELASLWHLPHAGFSAGTIVWTQGRHVPLPVQLRRNRQHIHLGENYYAGQQTPVYIRSEDRTGHMIVLGKTGMGKSTLLHNMLAQDISRGSGVAVIDPHGDLVRDILQRSIPRHREEDVVVWDLAELEHPPPLNLLSIPEQFDRAEAASQVMRIFEKIEPDGDFGGREMADTMTMALQTVMADDTPTIRDVNRLFEDAGYRWTLIEKLDSVAAEEFWASFDKRSNPQQFVNAVVRRLRRFYDSRILYPITCHPNSLDLSSLIADQKIILISLRPRPDIHLPPRTLNFLGAIMVSQFQMAVMAGVATAPFYLYIDEAERFVATAIDDIFNEARKRHLSLTIANQYLGQLKGDVLKAVMGNVGAMALFQLGDDDARAVAPYMRPNFTADDLVHLDKHQAAVFMRLKGEQQPAFSLFTRPAPAGYAPDEYLETEARIRQQSIARYTPQTLQAVMSWLDTRYPRQRRDTTLDTADQDDFYDVVE